MHELSLGTWFIHIATLFEWIIAIIVITIISFNQNKRPLIWLAVAMLPNLTSAMAAITWHIYDNALELKGLVVFQAGMTVIGNSTMAIAALNLLNKKKSNTAI
tara:strand:+ start:2432 stop:2740 length:309 start_codon:yes stop_codon:yes gene_type:complete